MSITRLTVPSLTLAIVLVAACGDDPVSHSEPVDLKLKVTSGDVTGGALSVDKNVNTEAGNPYGAFVAAAQAALGGDPGRIDVTAATLTVAPTSTGATQMGQVFAGTTDVTLVMNSGNVRFPVASHATVAADGAGPIGFTVGFDDAAVTPAELAGLIGGQFKVELAGPAAAAFAAAGASVDLDLAITLAAYE